MNGVYNNHVRLNAFVNASIVDIFGKNDESTLALTLVDDLVDTLVDTFVARVLGILLNMLFVVLGVCS